MAVYVKNKTPKKSRKKLLLVLIVALLLVGAGGGYAFVRHKTNNSKTTQTQTGTAVADTNVPGSEDKNSDTNSVTPGAISGPNNSKDLGANIPGQTSSGVQPNKPVGQFVSNEGSEQPASLTAGQESTCTTTPGVYCEIRFTQGSVTKKLPAQKTNAEGNIIWDWIPKELDLSAGTWQVTAVATNGDKTASTSGPQLILR